MRSATLAGYRAETAALAGRIAEHGHAGLTLPKCGCDEARAMRAELKERREAIRTWLDPAPDDVTLF
jgi:hypothetical protein